MKDDCVCVYLHLCVYNPPLEDGRTFVTYYDCADADTAAAAAAVGRTLPQRDTSVKTIRQRMLQQQQEEVEELVVPLEQEGNRSASSSRSFELL